MATPRLSRAKHKEIHELVSAGLTFQQVVRKAKVAIGTVSHYAKIPLPPDLEPPDVKSAQLPKSLTKSYPPFDIDTPGLWGVLSDVHLPYHDETTIEHAVKLFQRRNVVGLLINGDLLDCHELSDHDKDPTALRYQGEVEIG